MLYLDGFLIFLTAKVLALGSCTLNLPHGVMGITARERPRAPCPEQGHAKSIPRACPHSVRVPGSSGVMAWQGEGVGASRSPRAQGWALGERRGFVSTLLSLKAALQGSASIWLTGDPANTGFGGPARSRDRQEEAAVKGKGETHRVVTEAGTSATFSLSPGARAQQPETRLQSPRRSRTCEIQRHFLRRS